MRSNNKKSFRCFNSILFKVLLPIILSLIFVNCSEVAKVEKDILYDLNAKYGDNAKDFKIIYLDLADKDKVGKDPYKYECVYTYVKSILGKGQERKITAIFYILGKSGGVKDVQLKKTEVKVNGAWAETEPYEPEMKSFFGN